MNESKPDPGMLRATIFGTLRACRRRLGTLFCLSAVSAFLLIAGCSGGPLADFSNAPALSGCPTGEVAVDTPLVLTISVNEGSMILGVLPVDTANATTDPTRTGSNTFTVTVIPTAVGEVTVTFVVDVDLDSFASRLTCKFTAVTNLGACCDGIACEETDVDSCSASRTFFGAGTTCFPVNPCLGACCGLPTTVAFSTCILAGQNACETAGGEFHGASTTCEEILGSLAECPCVSDERCPDDSDPCTDAVCLLERCGQLNKCSGAGMCDPETGDCPIDIQVVFPSTLANRETADLIIHFSSDLDLDLTKKATFGSAVGQCPDGFGCPSKVQTDQRPSPLVILNAFTCLIDSATEPVNFLYEVSLTDADGLGSKTVTVPFVCTP